MKSLISSPVAARCSLFNVPCVLIILLTLAATLTGSLYTVCAAPAACGTQKGGLIFNEIWRPQDSPICLTNDTSLSNVSLLPGTIVYVGSNVTIHVLTTIHALGTSNAHIVFVAAPDNTVGWQGLDFQNTLPGSEFDWCDIGGAQNSALRLIRSVAIVRNTTFWTNSGSYGGAIYADLAGGMLLLTNCTFINNTAVNDGGAIWARMGTGQLHVARCTFDGSIANPGYQRRNTYGGAI